MAMADHAHTTDEYRAERARLHRLRLAIEASLESMTDLLDTLDRGADAEHEGGDHV